MKTFRIFLKFRIPSFSFEEKLEENKDILRKEVKTKFLPSIVSNIRK